MIRPCRSSTSGAVPNANFSYGDETNGIVLNDPSNLVAASSFTSLPTTGFDYFIRATKDNLYITLKIGTNDYYFSCGMFETLMTASPAEPYPLYMLGGISPSFGSQTEVALSRAPQVTTSNASNWRASTPNTSLQPLIGGIGSASVDILHGSSVLVGRPLVIHIGSNPQVLGQYRGQLVDVVLLSVSGGTTRSGDTVTMSGDVYVKNSWSAQSINHWVKRDAV